MNDKETAILGKYIIWKDLLYRGKNKPNYYPNISDCGGCGKPDEPSGCGACGGCGCSGCSH